MPAPDHIVSSVAAAAAFFTAGLWLFLLLFGRLLLGLEARPAKKLINTLILLMMTFVPAAFGFMTGFSRWLILPGLVFAGAVITHLRQARIRRHHRSWDPVESDAPGISLRKPVTTQDLTCKRYELVGPKWPPARFRVAVLSDFHVQDRLPIEYYFSAMDKAAALDPDVLFLAGDFISDDRFTELLPRVFARCKGRHGTFAVLGNHDFWEGAEGVIAALAESGVTHLANTSRRINVSENFSVLISGCEDPWGPGKWQAPERRPGEPLIVMTHTADNIYRLSRHGADAVFAGHYHGGQAVIPWLGAVVIPSRYGRRFDRGHFLVGDTHLFVTSGIGVAAPTIRLFCHPDILVVDFLSGPQQA